MSRGRKKKYDQVNGRINHHAHMHKRLLRAAMTVADRKGEATDGLAIATQAGTSVRPIYYHFRTKQGLIFTAYLQLLQPLLQAARHGDDASLYQNCIKHLQRLCHNHPGLVMVLSHSLVSPDPSAKILAETVIGALAYVIRNGRKKDYFSVRGSPRNIARIHLKQLLDASAARHAAMILKGTLRAQIGFNLRPPTAP